MAFLLFLSLTTTASFEQKTIFILEGHTFYKSGVARLFVYTSRSEFVPFDSAIIKDGVFVISDTIDEPKLFSLRFGEETKILFLGNERVLLTATDSISRKITVKGSALTNDHDYYTTRWIEPLKKELMEINRALSNLDSSDQQEIDSLNNIQSTLFASVPDSTAIFIKEHPSSFLSVYFLNYYGGAYEVGEMKSLFNLIDEKLKQSPSAEFIKEKILLASSQSSKCPDFNIRFDNNIISRASFKGNYLFIDFWATWCLPCIKNIPDIPKSSSPVSPFKL